MDEDVEKNVDDDSGNEMHGIANNVTIAPGKFTRARYFNGKGNIEIPHNDVMNLSKSDFSFCGWIKIESHTNPLTTLAVQQGLGCDYRPGRIGATPGWDIGHGFTHRGTRICIRDNLNNVGNEIIVHNDDVSNANLLGKWTHYVVVFNRRIGKIVLYINGKKQDPFIDISAVTGNINNDQPLVFGSLHGRKTKGFVDKYRLYNKALNEIEVIVIYKDHKA